MAGNAGNSPLAQRMAKTISAAQDYNGGPGSPGLGGMGVQGEGTPLSPHLRSPAAASPSSAGNDTWRLAPTLSRERLTSAQSSGGKVGPTPLGPARSAFRDPPSPFARVSPHWSLEFFSLTRGFRETLRRLAESSLARLAVAVKSGEVFQPLGSEELGLGVPLKSHSPLVATVRELCMLYWPSIFKALAVLQWWFFNVLLILLNKWIYQVYSFNFPLALTTVHFAMSFLGAYICIKVLGLKPLAVVSRGDVVRRVLPMAVVTNLNVCLGNLSLRYIPVTFMQTVKAFTPAVTVALQVLFQGRNFARLVYMSLVPVVGGVTLASATELSFHLWGFVAALTSTIFTSVNSILAEVLLKGKVDMDSINTVYYMAPQNALMLLPLAFIFEGRGLLMWLTDQPVPAGGQSVALALVLFSGVLAFGLNFSLFYAIQATSAMTFNVAGNLKVALAIVLGWLIFRNPMSYLNALGCSITVLGCTWYGYVMTTAKQQQDTYKQVEGEESLASSNDESLLVNDEEMKALNQKTDGSPSPKLNGLGQHVKGGD